MNTLLETLMKEIIDSDWILDLLTRTDMQDSKPCPKPTPAHHVAIPHNYVPSESVTESRNKNLLSLLRFVHDFYLKNKNRRNETIKKFYSAKLIIFSFFSRTKSSLPLPPFQWMKTPLRFQFMITWFPSSSSAVVPWRRISWTGAYLDHGEADARLEP